MTRNLNQNSPQPRFECGFSTIQNYSHYTTSSVTYSDSTFIQVRSASFTISSQPAPNSQLMQLPLLLRSPSYRKYFRIHRSVSVFHVNSAAPKIGKIPSISSAQVKNEWSCTSTPTYNFVAWTGTTSVDLTVNISWLQQLHLDWRHTWTNVYCLYSYLGLGRSFAGSNS